MPSRSLALHCVAADVLHLILLPTEACNFRCVYCYEEFKYKRMEPWVVAGVKNLLTHRMPGLRSLTISWFGGEPLLAQDIILDIQEHARHLVSSRSNLSFMTDMTTNGYTLSPSTLDQLVASGVDTYQISFDGPRAWHDRKRVLHGGKGTFDVIWGNLLAARSSSRDFRITIRLHVDRSNVAVADRFIDDCAEAFGTDPRFDLFIRELSRLGGANDPELQVFDRDEGHRAIEALRERAEARGLRHMEPGHLTDGVCYAARANSFVIRANGRVGKCTVALEHPNNHVGSLRSDGTLELSAPKMAQWMRGFESNSPEQLECPMEGYADRASDAAVAPA